jgi:hypothetical protein
MKSYKKNASLSALLNKRNKVGRVFGAYEREKRRT